MGLQTYRIAFTTILVKEVRRFARIWIQTILPPMITTALYFVIFGKMIGSQLAPIDGFSYMDYIVPGLIMMTVISNSYANVVSSFDMGRPSSDFSRRFEKHDSRQQSVDLNARIVGNMSMSIDKSLQI